MTLTLALAAAAISCATAEAKTISRGDAPTPCTSQCHVWRFEQLRSHTLWLRHDRAVHRRTVRRREARRRRAAAALATAAQATGPPPAVSTAGGGFPASCVANAEESGHNSIAGYFGFIYPPSAYGASGPSSWLEWSWSAQLAVAESLYARYGGGAWGPLTRERCGI